MEKAFIHFETCQPGSRHSRNISSVYSLPLLPYPIPYGFAISPRSHPIFCWGYLKSCPSHVTCSRITLKYFQICYYIRKGGLKLSRSCLGICSCCAHKAMCWLHTNWPITLLMKCSKQFRNSSQKAAWTFWRNYSLTIQEENGLDSERGNCNELVNVQLLSCQPVTWPPLISSESLLEDGAIIRLHWLSRLVSLHCYCLGLSISKSTPKHRGTMRVPLPAICYSENFFLSTSFPNKTTQDAM